MTTIVTRIKIILRFLFLPLTKKIESDKGISLAQYGISKSLSEFQRYSAPFFIVTLYATKIGAECSTSSVIYEINVINKRAFDVLCFPMQININAKSKSII